MTANRQQRAKSRLPGGAERSEDSPTPVGDGGTPTRPGAVPPANRRIAVAAGVLFLVATAAVLVADAVEPAFAAMAERPTGVAMASFLRIVAAGASVGIAVCLYPIIRPVGGAFAIGSVVFRTIEAAMYLAGVVALLGLPSLSRQLASSGQAVESPGQAMVDVLTEARHNAGLVAVFAFCVGAFMYYVLFYQARLVPAWLSVWGVLAVVLMFIACLLSLFGENPISDYKLLAAPIFVQEIVLGGWLLVAGFSSHDRDPRPDIAGPHGNGAAASAR